MNPINSPDPSSPPVPSTPDFLDDVFHAGPSGTNRASASSSLLSAAGATEIPHQSHPSALPPQQRVPAFNLGYADGAAAGRAEAVQQGFDAGYPRGAALGLQCGVLRGLLEGMVAATGSDGGSDEAREELKSALEEAERELSAGEVLKGPAEELAADADEGYGASRDTVSVHAMARWRARVEKLLQDWRVDAGLPSFEGREQVAPQKKEAG